MALHPRTAASAAALVAVLASPLAAAAQSRTGGGKPERAHATRNRARPQPPAGGAARAARADDRAEGGSQAAWDPDAVVRWEDQDGTVHYTRGYEVPQRFRPKVRHVQATVGSVPVDPAETKKSAASVETPASALPMTTLPPGPVPPPAARTLQGEPSGASQDSTTGPRQPTPGAAR